MGQLDGGGGHPGPGLLPELPRVRPRLEDQRPRRGRGPERRRRRQVSTRDVGRLVDAHRSRLASVRHGLEPFDAVVSELFL